MYHWRREGKGGQPPCKHKLTGVKETTPFHPMVNLQCSEDLRMFLCALYAPVCIEYGRVSMPCRALCHRAKRDCHKLMEMFGVTWPDEIECSRFPDCDEAYPRAVDLQTSVDPTDISPISIQRDYGFWCPRELKMEPDLGYSFLGTRDCSAPCPNMYFQRSELTFARYFIGVVSIVCLSATLFTFLTFLIDVTRFRYPERPIIFYAICYMMVSLVFFLGFLLEDRVACNAANPAQYRAATVTQGSHNKPCSCPPPPLLLLSPHLFFSLLSSPLLFFLFSSPLFLSLLQVCSLFFMVLYFFTMAGSVWPCSSTPALGACPAASPWPCWPSTRLRATVGVSLLLVGIVALNRVRMEIPLEKENQDKLVKFMIRIGVFSVLYLVPLLTVISCYLYENSNRAVWEITWVQERCRDYHIPCPYQVEQTSHPDLTLFLIKYMMMLVVGIPSVFWVGSKKTCFEWASFLQGRRRKDSGVNESRQVLQEPDFAQSLLRDPHTPIIRKSRGTSTQGTSTHASSTHLAILEEPDDPRHAPDDRGPIHSLGHASSTRSKAGSVHSKTSYHGSLHRSRDGRYTPCSYRGGEEQTIPPHSSMPHLDHPLSTHSSLHRLESQSRHSSQRDLVVASPTRITHGTSGGRVANDDDGASA
ncbi:unnamed protein product [Oncorhynchus mykiss]|uniref:FZ domain-containing protein n=1 Tax=Oncorhynchus mykiss TaxID=8022 RepID=A0A060WNL5_ONCMY|nr:unnamed protein product [Oncorhynchus mykiss]